jgi:hypothetical protein
MKRKLELHIAIGVLLIAVPLELATFSVAKSSRQQSQVTDITLDWLDRNDTPLELDGVNVFNKNVEIVLHGSVEPQAMSELAEELESAFPEMGEAKLQINVAGVLPVPRAVSEE